MAGTDPYLQTQFQVLLNRIPGRLQASDLELVRLPMLVQVLEGWGHDQRQFEDDGISVIARMGDVIALTASYAAFGRLMADPNVVAIEASRDSAAEECSHSIPFTKANAVHLSPTAERGDKSLVAIIDDGIDPYHDAFSRSDGSSRIHAYWDMRATQGGQARMPSGRVFRRNDLNQIRRSKTSTSHKKVERNSSHGTHVASIAAGNAAGSFSGGMAPAANIAAVRLALSPEFGSAVSHIAALSFIDEMLMETELPTVINLSLGLAGGARDGSSLFERAIDNLTERGTRPGMVVIKSAGNEFGQRRHVRGVLGRQGERIFSWKTGGGTHLQDTVEFWIESRGDVLCSLVYNGRTFWANVSPGCCSDFNRTGDGNACELLYLQDHHSNGDGYVKVSVIAAEGDDIQPADLSITFVNTSPFESIINGWADHTRGARIRFDEAQDDVTITTPGCSHSVICVGAASSTNSPTPNIDSSMGPTRDNREKPELCAPGDGVVAAHAGTVGETSVMSGTSQAAAHVTGAVALLLSRFKKYSDMHPEQNLRSLTSKQVKSKLIRSLQFAKPFHDRRLGFGMLDVQALFDDLSM